MKLYLVYTQAPFCNGEITQAVVAANSTEEAIATLIDWGTAYGDRHPHAWPVPGEWGGWETRYLDSSSRTEPGVVHAEGVYDDAEYR